MSDESFHTLKIRPEALERIDTKDVSRQDNDDESAKGKRDTSQFWAVGWIAKSKDCVEDEGNFNKNPESQGFSADIGKKKAGGDNKGDEWSGEK